MKRLRRIVMVDRGNAVIETSDGRAHAVTRSALPGLEVGMLWPRRCHPRRLFR